ncbi:MAG: cytidine deaminase [Ilumatobacter sp.]|uniref:cytidine deaminase n=1 Tax=Ilumatobacter sp. TaxID=1967498 RepID=UPI002635389E|nr:cytidine deaminase [Ilumatobacter sp.]MDJ0770688.1 cytidine deaminase [Ilumatobacter sp.]
MTPTALVAAARDCRTNAHVPYSKFRAGASVHTDRDEIVPGVIVENVSLGLAMCAERVALFSTVALGARPLALALVAPRTGKDLTWPCGACLQVALELGGPDMPIYASSIREDAPISESTVGELLPKGPFVHR